MMRPSNDHMLHSRAQTFNIGDPGRASTMFTEDNSLSLLKKRITDLEIENGILSNGYEVNRIQLSQSIEKVELLDKQVQDLRAENNGLKAIVGQMRQDYQTLSSTIMKEITELKQASVSKKESTVAPIIGRKIRSAKHTAIDNSPAKYGKLSFFGEADLFSRGNSERSDNLVRNDSHGSASPSFIHDYDGSDKHFGVPIPEEEAKEIILDAVHPRSNLYNFPGDSMAASQLLRKASGQDNEPPSAGLNKGQGRTELPSPNVGISMKKTFMESAKVFKPDRLFENFLVLGITKDDALEKIKSSNGTKNKPGDSATFSFSANIVYDFAESAGLEKKVTLPDIERFLTPWQLLMTPYKVYSNVADSTFYKIVLKSQKKYKKRYICPFQPHNGDIQLSKWTEYVEAVNPQNKLYAICIKKGDYIIADSLVKNKEYFVHIDTVYCLLTYYPIPELAFNFLSSVLNFTRMKRKELYWAAGGDNKNTDFSKLLTLFPSCVSYLKQIMGLEIPGPERMFSYPINNDKVAEYDMLEYKFPAQEKAYLELAMWEAHKIFEMFTLANINRILSAILLEKSIVFFSHDIKTLTSTLNTFLGLLFPFKYVCTLIPAIPSNSEFLFEAPVPIIIGVNRNEDYFWKKELDTKSTCIFVFIDSQIIFVDRDHHELINYPQLDFIVEGLESKFDPNCKGFDVIFDPETLEKRIPKTTPTETEKPKKDKDDSPEASEEAVVKAKEIFEHFRVQLMEQVVSVFANFKDYNPQIATDQDFEEKIIANISSDRLKRFFYAFKDTQEFNSYPYSVSLPEKKE